MTSPKVVLQVKKIRIANVAENLRTAETTEPPNPCRVKTSGHAAGHVRPLICQPAPSDHRRDNDGRAGTDENRTRRDILGHPESRPLLERNFVCEYLECRIEQFCGNDEPDAENDRNPLPCPEATPNAGSHRHRGNHQLDLRVSPPTQVCPQAAPRMSS